MKYRSYLLLGSFSSLNKVINCYIVVIIYLGVTLANFYNVIFILYLTLISLIVKIAFHYSYISKNFYIYSLFISSFTYYVKLIEYLPQ